ncbi:MAG: Y-family DNA polymerase [Bdellovibrionales bacterium]|nr:Y-family DNA polymerase [Bdellovibrionales bacterium]
MLNSLIALIDCNSFYASCERVFRPELRNRPVMVLSNNDGCVIARTQEVKDLGIAMGVPFFKVRALAKKHNIAVFSSNYALYGDMSRRVMKTLEQFTPEIEVYSIDEAFLYFDGFEHWNLSEHAKKIRNTILQHTGIPTSIGFAPTKVLAKVANKLAKKNSIYEGICVLDTEEKIKEALLSFPIGDLWGIGRQLEKKWHALGITTAWQLRNLPERTVRKIMTVQGHRMVLELKGIPCFAYKDMMDPKKQIISTRSFGHPITKINDLKESIANHVSRAAEKLRAQGSVCQSLYVFIRNNPFKDKGKTFYYAFDIAHFDPGTQVTNKLIDQAVKIIDRIYKLGVVYKKSGVCLSEISPQSQTQQHLFVSGDTNKNIRVMRTLDLINQRQGKGSLKFATCGTFNNNWPMQSKHRSPCYTTRWSELLKVG